MSTWIVVLGALFSGVSWYYVARVYFHFARGTAVTLRLQKGGDDYRPRANLSWRYFVTRWAIVSALFAGIVSLSGIRDLANFGIMMAFAALFNAIFLNELRRDSVGPFRYLVPEAWKFGLSVNFAGVLLALAAAVGPMYYLIRAEGAYIRDVTAGTETRDGVMTKVILVDRVFETQRDGTLWFEVHPRGEDRVYLIEESPDHNVLLTDLKSAVALESVTTREHLLRVNWTAENVAATKQGVERIEAKVEPTETVLTQVVTL